MPSNFNSVAVVVTINGTSVQASLVRYQNQVGGAPAEAEFVFYNTVISNSGVGAIKGKPCVLTINGSTFLTGTIVEWKLNYQDAPPGGTPVCEVSFIAVDARWLMAKDYVGRRHLDALDAQGNTTQANGVRVVGADIIFNRVTPVESRNMDNTTGIALGVNPAFVYDKGNTTDEEICVSGGGSFLEASFWTYGDAILWMFQHYVDDVTQILVAGHVVALSTATFASAISGFADMTRLTEEINLFGLNVVAAIDELFLRTQSNWFLDGNNVLCIFNRANPLAAETLKVGDPLAPALAGDFDANTLCRLNLCGGIRNVVNRMDIVGGTIIREINANSIDDFYPVRDDYSFQTGGVPAGSPLFGSNGFPIFGVPLLAGTNTPGSTSNYLRLHNVRLGLNHSRYENHGAGRNTRRKDLAKPLQGELLLKKERDGNWVSSDNECGIYSFPINETIRPWVWTGCEIDLDRSEISFTVFDGVVAGGIIVFPSMTPPLSGLIAPIETEIRAWVEAAQTLASLPSNRYGAVIRSEIRHKSRESYPISFPVLINYVYHATGDVTTGTWDYTVFEPLALPPGATRNYPLSGTHVANLPNFTLTLAAGVVFDGIGALNELKDIAQSEVGREAVNMEGAFPMWRLTSLGSQLTIDGGGFPEATTGQEVVVALFFDGQTQETSFAASNYIGANASELAKSFINQRVFRKGV